MQAVPRPQEWCLHERRSPARRPTPQGCCRRCSPREAPLPLPRWGQQSCPCGLEVYPEMKEEPRSDTSYHHQKKQIATNIIAGPPNHHQSHTPTYITTIYTPNTTLHTKETTHHESHHTKICTTTSCHHQLPSDFAGVSQEGGFTKRRIYTKLDGSKRGTSFPYQAPGFTKMVIIT